jgi:hypothetical protein
MKLEQRLKEETHSLNLKNMKFGQNLLPLPWSVAYVKFTPKYIIAGGDGDGYQIFVKVPITLFW